MGEEHRPPVEGEERLPAVLDVPQAARMLGIGRTLAYELVRTDEWLWGSKTSARRCLLGWA